MEDCADRMQRCRDYVEALEEERRKIQVFHRELPLCLELVTQAIDACRGELGTTASEYFPGRSECSEQTSSEAPMLEEFIPIKRSSPSHEEEESHNKHECEERNDKDKPLQKADWLRSVQLWNTDPDPPPKQDEATRKVSVIETKKTGGAFHAFRRENKGVTATSVVATTPSSAQTAAASSTTAATTDTAANGGVVSVNNGNGGGSCEKEDKEGQSQRKPRRCWSPELHRRFLHALQQLGGSHAATPKQIRELMKVDGLTNDEVKSHLQKYRLHTRRPRSAAIPNGSDPQPQFVVVGGIWVTPPEYAAVAATATGETNGVAANGIYAPVAKLAPPPPATVKQSQRSASNSEERESRSSDEKSHSNSSASSTHTTTASPAF